MGPQSGRPQLISEVAEARRWADESKSGQFAEALAAEARIKRERLHKVLAQSGHGSRRDMEILISSGRVMVNGIVATTGTSVSANDQVMIDHRPVKLKFSEELPRVLLYHKPEGEIVTTNDPGNRITVFDNLPRVENGKWISVGRLDINTSGLLIFTTSGELANRLMHPRYEVEREYAVRLLGELTEEQTATLMAGVSISNERDTDDDDDNEPIVDERPARFDVIEKRGGEGVNQWYHVVIREGRNREVRRMFEAVGLTVSRLMRVRFGKIGLPPRLSRGRMMELDPAQVRSVLRWVGMEAEGPTAPLPGFAAPSGPRPVGSAVDTASTGSSEATRVPSTDGSMRPKRHRARRSRGRPDEAGELGQMHSGLDAQNGEAPALGAHGGGVPGDASVPRIDGQPDPRARKNRRGTRGRQRRRGPPDAVGGGGANVANAVPSVNVGPASTPSGAREQPTDDNVGNRVDGNSPTFASPFQEKRAGRDQRDRRGFRGRRRNRRSDEGAPSGNVDAPSGGTDRFDSGNEPDGNR
jgi:23S rRNA pseudouridine2605 synthase